jgi:hypothetical protein
VMRRGQQSEVCWSVSKISYEPELRAMDLQKHNLTCTRELVSGGRSPRGAHDKMFMEAPSWGTKLCVEPKHQEPEWQIEARHP